MIRPFWRFIPWGFSTVCRSCHRKPRRRLWVPRMRANSDRDDFEPPVPRRNKHRSGGRSGLIPDVRMQERAGETCRSPDETGQRQIAPCRAQGAERLPRPGCGAPAAGRPGRRLRTTKRRSGVRMGRHRTYWPTRPRRSRFRPSARPVRGAPFWSGAPYRGRGRRRSFRAGC